MKRASRLLVVGVAAWLAFALAGATSPFHQGASAASSNRAGVVVRFSDGTVRHQCVAFSEPQITGWDLLDRTSFDVKRKGSGPATQVCMIDGEGRDPGKGESCLGSGNTPFWQYWNKDSAPDWAFASVGAGSRTVRDGSLDGWSWGSNRAPVPPNLSFSQVCPASQSSSTPKPAPASSSTQTPRASTPAPTAAAPAPTSAAAGSRLQNPAPTAAGARTPVPAAAEHTPELTPELTPEPEGQEEATPVPAPDERRDLAQPERETASSSSYIGFVLFLAAFAVAGVAAVLARRRRTS